MTGLTNGREARKTSSRMREPARRKSRRPGRDGGGRASSTSSSLALSAAPRRLRMSGSERNGGAPQGRLAKHSNEGERRKRNPFIKEPEERGEDIEQPDLPEAKGLTPQEF